MAPRLYRLAETPVGSPSVDEDPSYRPPSLPIASGYDSTTSSSSSDVTDFVDEEPLDKVIASLVHARHALVPASATAAVTSPPSRPIASRKKKRLLVGVDADDEPLPSEASSHSSSSSSGIETPDVGVDADPEDFTEVKRHTLTLMPHPVLNRYHDDEDRDNDRETDEPSPPSPLSPSSAVIDLVDLPMHTTTVDHRNMPVVNLYESDSTPGHSPQLQPRMSANDLDVLFNEDPSSPPSGGNGNAHNDSEDAHLRDHTPFSSEQKPPAEAMIEADAWRPAIQSEAKMAYDHFQMYQGQDAEYACAVMPVNTLLTVMVEVGDFIGATSIVAQGSTGKHVDLRRTSHAMQLPDFESFVTYVDETLDGIIIQDVLDRTERKRLEEEERQREENEKKKKKLEERRQAEKKRKDDDRQRRADLEREERRQMERARAKAQARARARRQLSAPRSNRTKAPTASAIDIDQQTPQIVGPHVNYRSISAPNSFRGRTPVISFDDDDESSPPASPPPPRQASLQAERDVARFVAHANLSSSSDDDLPPRPHTRMFALKQKRVIEKEKRKMLGPGADIKELRRQSNIMKFRAAKLRKRRSAERKYMPVFPSPGNSKEDFFDEIAAMLPEDLEEDEIQEGPVTQRAAKRRRLHRTVDISDDEVEEVEVQPTPPPRPRKRPVMVNTSFQPKPEVPSSYMMVMTGKTEELEWGDMGDNFTVLGKRQRWELDPSSISEPHKPPPSFEERWQTQMQQASARRMHTLRERLPRIAEAPSTNIEAMTAERQDRRVRGHAERRVVERVDTEDRCKRDRLERERVAQQKQELSSKLRASRAATTSGRTRSSVTTSGHSQTIGGGVSKKSRRKAKVKTVKTGGHGGYSRRELRRLRREEEDYREKEDPRHPEYVSRQKSNQVAQEKSAELQLALQLKEQQRSMQKNGDASSHRTWAGVHPEKSSAKVQGQREDLVQSSRTDKSKERGAASSKYHESRSGIPRRKDPAPRHDVEAGSSSARTSSRQAKGLRKEQERESVRRRYPLRGESESKRHGGQGGSSNANGSHHSRRAGNAAGGGGRGSRSSRRGPTPASGFGGQDPSMAAPIGIGNKGFALLEKMGWKEGEGLGRSRRGRTSPIAPDRLGGRSGLGQGRR